MSQERGVSRVVNLPPAEPDDKVAGPCFRRCLCSR